jgi:hypothetical protein
MSTDTKKTTESTAAEEPRNVVIFALENRLKVGKAIVAYGRVDFPVTKSQADALVSLGKARIEGVI